MRRPPSFQRYLEIEAEYQNRENSNLGRKAIWSLTGELLQIVEAMVKEATFERLTAPVTPSEPTASTPIPARPQKPPTPSPAEWKRMTPEQQTAHFKAVQAYEESLTPEDKAALLAAEAEIEAAHRERFAGYKSQFDPDRPYTPPGG